MRQALERDRPHRLPQQLPALLHLVGGDVVHAHELRMLHVMLGVGGLQLREHGVGVPHLARRPGLRCLGEPEFQPLVGRVGGEQPVQRRGAGPRQAGNEDRPVDADVRVLGVLPPARLAEQPGRQRAAQEDAVHLGAERGEVLLGGVRLQQHGEPVTVVVGAEVVQAGEPGRRCVQVVDRPHDTAARRWLPWGRQVRAAPRDPAQWWNSPQLTSRHWPVMDRASQDDRNTTASAISSGSGSRRRSVPAAVSS